MANDGTGTGWDETAPANSEDLSRGAQEIRDSRIGIGDRIAKEHLQPAPEGVGGEHSKGSAVSYYQAAEPTNRPDGVTALSAADKGRLWIDTDDDKLHIWSGSVWDDLIVGGENYKAASVEHTDLTAAAIALLNPIGLVAPFAGVAAPTGWLLCNGTAVSRTTYEPLFEVISTLYGIGNGTTTFTLPDMRGNVPIGVSGSYALAAAGGAATHSLTAAQNGEHTHNVVAGGMATGSLTKIRNNLASGTLNSVTTSSGNGSAHNNIQPYLALNYIIKT